MYVLVLYLERSAPGLGELPLVQLLPALDELLDDGVLRADDLEACDVGSSRHHAVETHVGHALQRTDHNNTVVLHTVVLHTMSDTPCSNMSCRLYIYNIILHTVIIHIIITLTVMLQDI